jgi:hypothetical protein
VSVDETQILQTAEKAAGSAKPWLALYARAGYVARGAVYSMVGWMALTAAVGVGGRITDAQGALSRLSGWRRPVLLLIAIGLVGFASLRLLQGLLDPERRGRSMRAIAVRVGEAFTGIGHLWMAYGAWRLWRHAGTLRGGDGNARRISRDLLDLPHGEALLGTAGVAVAVIGLVLVIRAAFSPDICRNLSLDRLTPAACRAVSALVRVAEGAQGLLLVAIGWFAAGAAWTTHPATARGPAGVLRQLAHLPFGRLWLAMLACGVLAVAASSFADALWRRFPGVTAQA